MKISDTNIYSVEVDKVCRLSLNIRVPKSITDESTIERMIADAINESILGEEDFMCEYDEIDTSTIYINQVQSDSSYFERKFGSKLITLNGPLKEYEEYNNISVVVEELNLEIE